MSFIPQYDAQQVHRQGHGAVSFGGDERLLVWFFDKPIIDGIQSKEKNTPHFVNVCHVHIQQPAERDCFEQPASQEHIARFPKQYDAYRNNKTVEMEGTPLSVLFPSDMAIVETMKHAHVHTVQQLAGLTDTQIQNIGLGGRAFHQKAQAFLAAHDDGKQLNALLSKVEAMEQREQEKDAKINALERALGEKSTAKRGPGRPKKQEEQEAA